jgi:hypothetical protein
MQVLLLLRSRIFLANDQNLVAPNIYTQSCHFDEGEIFARSSAKKIMFFSYRLDLNEQVCLQSLSSYLRGFLLRRNDKIVFKLCDFYISCQTLNTNKNPPLMKKFSFNS